jgi:hypothetical protein
MKRSVFRPEKPKLVMWGVLFILCDVLAFGFLRERSDPYWWVPSAVFVCGAVVSLRALLVRVVADKHGVDVINQWSRPHYVWSDIDRFDVSPWFAFAVVVTKDGKKHRLGNQQMSSAERFLGLRNHTENVVASLNDLLESTNHRRSR